MRLSIGALVLAISLTATIAAAEPPPATDGKAFGVTDEARCHLLTNVASQLRGTVIGGVEGNRGQQNVLDCSAAFAAAGLNVVPDIPAARRSQDQHAWLFTMPQYLDAKSAVVFAGDVCPTCGHGEAVTVTLEGDYWKVTGRETTWMS